MALENGCRGLGLQPGVRRCRDDGRAGRSGRLRKSPCVTPERRMCGSEHLAVRGGHRPGVDLVRARRRHGGLLLGGDRSVPVREAGPRPVRHPFRGHGERIGHLLFGAPAGVRVEHGSDRCARAGAPVVRGRRDRAGLDRALVVRGLRHLLRAPLFREPGRRGRLPSSPGREPVELSGVGRDRTSGRSPVRRPLRPAQPQQLREGCVGAPHAPGDHGRRRVLPRHSRLLCEPCRHRCDVRGLCL